MSIKTKILIPMLALAVLIAGGILVSVILLFSGYINDIKLERVAIASDVAQYNVEVLMAKSQNASMYMSEHSGIIGALESGDRNDLLTHARQVQNDAGMEFCTIVDPNGIVILRTHEPDNFGDSLAGQANIRSAMSGSSLTAIETGTAIRLSIRSGSPIYGNQGELIGIVSVGFRLDTNIFADTIKDLQGCEVTVFLGDESISSTVINSDGSRVTGTKTSAEIAAEVYANKNYSGRSTIMGRDAISGYSPVLGPDGRVIAMISVGYYVDDMMAVIWSFVQTGLIVTFILLAVAVVIGIAVANLIAKPIAVITHAAEAIAIGDIELEGMDTGTTPTKSETIKLERAFSVMLASFKKQAYILARIAEGDYTSKVNIRSEKDVINLAIELTLENTLQVLQQVATAGMQVADGSKQIAEGAQLLAQGSTEQAATVEELSTALGEIAYKTKSNAEMADRASSLANTIKQSAEKGNGQMLEMMDAVRDINQASQSISKVIKVIDDIAFQTNILALNAAVEAARAGQHGKGFAVVAEEVRNLAAKSAEAAKDTGGLITNSIEKAELGSRIASETAASLTEIVTGINESAKIVGDIAQSSSEQSRDIEHINTGINQVAQVVNQNSATAQESAAASQEMSGQSAMLDELIRQFQLKDYSRGKDHMLPPGKA